MYIKLIVIFVISFGMIFYGISWLRKSIDADEHYNFNDDLNHSFMTFHGKYSSFFNDGKPRRIVPVLVIIGGIAILIVGLVNIL